jgi:hypothetical protein
MRVRKWRLLGVSLLGSAVLSAIVLGPLGLFGYVAGFLKSSTLLLFLTLCGIVGWPLLLVVACVGMVRGLRGGLWRATSLWSSIAFGIVLAIVLQIAGKTPAAIQVFGHGVFRRLEMRTDIDAVQTWVASLAPRDCAVDPHSGSRGRYLREAEQPEVLKRQDGMTNLELDGDGRPCVRLAWYESKAGSWGLVIGHRDMKTPPSDPNMYGEKRTELRPGVYFWYEEG